MPQRFREPTKARPIRPRLRWAACRHPRRFLGRDQLRSVGSVRSQADEARRHAGGRTSGNGPDTTERAPLDARGWVPSVFRARPAIKMQECLCLCPGSDWPPAPARFNAPRGGLRAASICNHFVAAQVEETEPRSAAGLRPGRRDSVDTGGGSRAAETRAAGENRLRRAQVH